MSHAWWWSRASYFQIRSPSHPDPIHDPFLGPLTFRRHHAQHLILLLPTIMIMFFKTFPPELKSVASASSTGAVTSSARHAQSLSSSLSVNNLLITIKRPFSTKTSFWFYSHSLFNYLILWICRHLSKDGSPSQLYVGQLSPDGARPFMWTASRRT